MPTKHPDALPPDTPLPPAGTAQRDGYIEPPAEGPLPSSDGTITSVAQPVPRPAQPLADPSGDAEQARRNRAAEASD